MRSTHPAADITSTVTDVDNQLTLTKAVDSCQRIMAQLSDSEDQLRLLSDLFVSYLQAKSIYPRKFTLPKNPYFTQENYTFTIFS